MYVFYIKAYKYISRYVLYMTSQYINNIIDDEIIKAINDYNNKIVGGSKRDGEDKISKIDVLGYLEKICDKNKTIEHDIIYNRICKIKNNRETLRALIKIPEIKQRTEEWFEARKTRLTASDLYDAIKPSNVSTMLAKKKAKIVVDKINYNGIPALKWGTMFEPMATRCYSQQNNNIGIYDFGLICDPNNEHFGASPDGINELGIMIEIKCPYSRKIIDTFIPEKYKLQIQGQLAVCNLDECDYVECEFKTIDEESEYLEEFKDRKANHGIIAEYIYETGEYHYLYSKENLSPSQCLENITDQKYNFASALSDLPNKPRYTKLIYWKLEKINTQRVKFNKEVWDTIVPKINEFWQKVEEFKLLPVETTVKKFQFLEDNDE
jgi:putative phage-type endonuclease